MDQNIKSFSFDWILIGFILHALGGIFYYSSKPICYTLCGLGLVIIFSNGFLQSPYELPFKGIVRTLFYLYLLWSVFIIIYPFFSSEPFKRDGYSLISPVTWLSFTTPLVVFLGFKNFSIKTIFIFSIINIIIGIILLIIFYQDIFAVKQDFDIDEYQNYIITVNIPIQFLSAFSFMVLAYPFLPTRYRIIAFLAMFLSLFIALYTARRSYAFMYILILFFSFYQFSFMTPKGSKLLRLFLVSAISISGIVIYNSYSNSIFSFFETRIFEDTRTGVDEYFFKSFKDKPLDWIIGRGINGSYFAPGFPDPNRAMIETGYLHIILKGGLIYLALYLFFLVHSAYLGFFRTKNRLTKAMSLYLVAHIAFLIPWGLPSFDFEFVLLWTFILYCQSKVWRTYTDLEINNKLNFKRRTQSLPVIKFNYQ